MTLNEFDENRRRNLIKKLVSNSRAIISNHIGLPLGVSKMRGIISWIDDIEPIKNIDLKVFAEYMSNTTNLPLGTERLAYNIEYLKQQDKVLDELTSRYKYRLIEKCFEIIDKLSSDK